MVLSMRTTIDLFAGAGGASIGLRNAGFHHELCVERDEDAASTLVAAGLPGVHGDVRHFIHYDKLKRVDLVWASPPCQAFSIAGDRKGALDDRNGWPWTLDVIDHLRSRGIWPEYVICENVPGLTYHTSDCDRSDYTKCSGCYWEAWVQPEFRKRFDWVGTVMLNAADFGVPQHRRRVFLVAGPKPIHWPQKTHCSPDKINQQTMFGPVMKPWVSIGEALGITTKIIGGGRNPTSAEDDKRTYRDITNEPSTTVAAVQIGNAGPFILTEEQKAEKKRHDRWLADGSDVDGPCRTIGTKGNRYLYEEDGKSVVLESDLLPANVNRRRLTWRECAKLQGFPDDHPFQGKTQASFYKQAGNAVCPIVSEVLGRCVLQAMDS
jgi:DNA (cytosine-5)-methyltransferase 1